MIEAELEKLTTSLENGVRAAANAIVDDILRAELRVKLNQQQEELTHWKAKLTAKQSDLDAQRLSLEIDPRQAIEPKRKPKSLIGYQKHYRLPRGFYPNTYSKWVRDGTSTVREVIHIFPVTRVVALRSIGSELVTEVSLERFRQRYSCVNENLADAIHSGDQYDAAALTPKRREPKNPVSDRVGDDSSCLSGGVNVDAVLPEIGSLWIRKRGGTLREVITACGYYVTLRTVHTDLESSIELKEFYKRYTLSGGSLKYVDAPKPHVRSLPDDPPKPVTTEQLSASAREELELTMKQRKYMPEAGSLWMHKRRGSLRKVVRTYLDNCVELETLETGKRGITELKWFRRNYTAVGYGSRA